EDQKLGEGVGVELVSAVERNARNFASNIKSLQGCFGVDVRGNAAHHIIYYKPYRNQLINRIYTDVLAHQLSDKKKFLIDHFFTQIAQIEVHIITIKTVEHVTFNVFLHMTTRENIARA